MAFFLSSGRECVWAPWGVQAYFASVLEPGWKIEIEMIRNFFPTEDYHQDYLDKNPGGYCHANLGLIKPSEKKDVA